MNGKTVKDSVVVISHVMLPQDANPAGNVHGGVIMKLIDQIATVVAMRHARSIAVTASIDRIDFHYPIFVGNMLTLKASVNMVGTTSMEVGVRAESEDLFSGEVTRTASAYLTLVAMNKNRRPKPVPPLIVESEEEKRRNEQAAERRKMRLAEKKSEAARPKTTGS